MATNNRRDFGKLIASLTKIFKSSDQGLVDDLSDSIDIDAPKETGMWPGNGARTHNIGMGPMESSSGSGAERFVSDYANPAEQTGLSAAYAAMAEELASTSKRVQSVEKSVVAIAGLLSAAMKGERFPDEMDEEKGKEDGETEEDEASSKSALPTMDIPSLMRSLASTSRSSVPSTLASPPAMHVIKAGADAMTAAIEDADMRGDFAEALRLKTLRMRAIAKANGAPVSDRLLAGSDFYGQPVSHRQPL